MPQRVAAIRCGYAAVIILMPPLFSLAALRHYATLAADDSALLRAATLRSSLIFFDMRRRC